MPFSHNLELPPKSWAKKAFPLGPLIFSALTGALASLVTTSVSLEPPESIKKPQKFVSPLCWEKRFSGAMLPLNYTVDYVMFLLTHLKLIDFDIRPKAQNKACKCPYQNKFPGKGEGQMWSANGI